MKKDLILPPNYEKILSSDNNNEEFYDYQDDLYRDKHYGLYLMSDSERVYLDQEAYKEYRYENMPSYHKASYEIKGTASHNLYTLFPSRKQEIWRLLQLIYTYQKSIVLVKDLLRGINELIVFIENCKVDLSLTLDLVTKENIALLKEYIESDTCHFTRGRYISSVLYLIMEHVEDRFELPHFDKLIKDRRSSIERKVQEKNKSNSFYLDNAYDNEGRLSISVGWQMDVYCRKELDAWVERIEEFKGWKKEYEDIEKKGGIFTLENLAYTYFYCQDTYGKGSSNYLNLYNEVAKKLYGQSFYWKDKEKFSKLKGNYKSARALQYEQELRNLGKDGILIEIDSLKMFTFWMFEIFPKYPYTITPDERFQSISYFKKNTKANNPYQSAQTWKSNRLTELGIDTYDYFSLYTTTSYHLYSLYALILLRSGLNQEVLQDWRVQKYDNGEYSIGKKAGPVHIIEGYKGRSNSIQSYTLDIEVNKYVQFFLEHMSPLYDISGDNHFFQYKTLSSDKCYVWSKSTQSNLQRRKLGVPIFGKYEIITNSGKRIPWIDHRQIRPMKNFAEYRNDVARIQRQIEMGHFNTETLNQYQQSLTFKGSDNIKTAITQNTIIAIFKGEITSKENKKAAIFEEQPMNKCSNSKNPSYPNSKKLKDDERCVNWRMCLLCSECKVIPELHGPVIQAWQNVMIEEADNFYATEDWEKEYGLDFSITTSVLDMFDKDDKKHCIKEAAKFQEFVRAYVMNSLEKTKVGA